MTTRSKGLMSRWKGKCGAGGGGLPVWFVVVMARVERRRRRCRSKCRCSVEWALKVSGLRRDSGGLARIALALAAGM